MQWGMSAEDKPCRFLAKSKCATCGFCHGVFCKIYHKFYFALQTMNSMDGSVAKFCIIEGIYMGRNVWWERLFIFRLEKQKG